MEPIFKLPENIRELHTSIVAGNNKLGPIPNFSTLPSDGYLEAADGRKICETVGTCAGVCYECKDHCYAVRLARGAFRHNTVPAWQKNTWLMRNMPERIFSDVVKYCTANRMRPVELFRINVSGEVENPDQLLIWFAVAIACPNTRFYMYTKNTAVLEKTLSYVQNIPANLAINISQWDNTVENKFGLQEFIYDDGSDPSLENVFHCPAVGKNGKSTGVKCFQCRRCTRRCDGQKTAVYAH